MIESYRQIGAEIEPRGEWGFRELQERVGNIYSEHDKKCGYGPDTILAKLLGNVVTLTHAIRKTPNDTETIDRSLTNVFIWATTVANIANIDLQQTMQEKFGEGCPHCKQMPCLLAQEKKCEAPLEPILKSKLLTMPESLSGWQEHFKKMYANNFTGDLTQALRFCSARTLEEAGELLASAYKDIENEIKNISFDPVVSSSFKSEIADLIAWAMAVANCLEAKNRHYSIEVSLKEKYEDGCHYCKSPKCICKKEKTIIENLRKTSKN